MVFSEITYDDIERGECFSAWRCEHREKLENRKYNELGHRRVGYVRDWVYAHEDEIEGLPLEEQEAMMIADGVITADDI